MNHDIAVLASIQFYLSRAQNFIGDMSFEQFLTDERTQFACAMAIAQAGEKAKQFYLSNCVRKHPQLIGKALQAYATGLCMDMTI